MLRDIMFIVIILIALTITIVIPVFPTAASLVLALILGISVINFFTK